MNNGQAGLSQVRRPQARGARTRERLLVSARDLFAKGGYEGTSIGDVAHRAGVGVGTVYHHFTDKRALLIALLERYESVGLAGDDPRGGLGIALEEADMGIALHALVRVAVDLRRLHPSVYPMGQELARRDPEVAACCQRVETGMRARLRRAIAHGQEAGKIRAEVDAVAAAFVLHQTMYSVVTRISEQPPEVDPEPMIAELASLLERYLLI